MHTTTRIVAGTVATDRPGTVLVMAASTRRGSINRALAEALAERLGSHVPTEIVDLANHPMPLYDGDLEDREGVPPTASSLAARFAAADVLVIVSPEYNGTYPPLLKNTVDWVTRVDMAALAHLRVLVASASPGAGGGATGAAMLRSWMSNMRVDTADRHLCVGGAALDADGRLVGLDPAELDRFAEQVLHTVPAT